MKLCGRILKGGGKNDHVWKAPREEDEIFFLCGRSSEGGGKMCGRFRKEVVNVWKVPEGGG